MIIPNMWKNKIHVPNHQPGIIVYSPLFFVAMSMVNRNKHLQMRGVLSCAPNQVIGPWLGIETQPPDTETVELLLRHGGIMLHQQSRRDFPSWIA